MSNDLMTAKNIITTEAQRISELMQSAKYQGQEKAYDKSRAALKAIERDLTWVISTLGKVASIKNPLLSQIEKMVKQGLTDEQIAKKFDHEDAEVVGDAIVEAHKKVKRIAECLLCNRKKNNDKISNQIKAVRKLLRRK